MYHDCQKTDAKDSNNMDTFDDSIFEDSLDNYVVNIVTSIYTDFYDYEDYDMLSISLFK